MDFLEVVVAEAGLPAALAHTLAAGLVGVMGVADAEPQVEVDGRPG